MATASTPPRTRRCSPVRASAFNLVLAIMLGAGLCACDDDNHGDTPDSAVGDGDGDKHAPGDGDGPNSGPGPNAGDGDGDEGDGDGGDGDSGDGDVIGPTGDGDSSALIPGGNVELGLDDDAGVAPGLEPPRTNPFVIAQHDPFATFAADVDTASYDALVRDVGRGARPVPRLVRLEEYVNYFHYDYPAPGADAMHPFSIALEAVRAPMREHVHVVRVGIAAKPLDPQSRPRANLVFLVDVSGSMGTPDKLPMVKATLKAALPSLKSDDLVSIVTYSGATEVRLEPTPVRARETIERVIDELTAGGSTAGGSGIQLAYQQARSKRIADGINHVVLCTDGDFNVGITDPEALVALIEEERLDGITLTALGFGRNRNAEDMMERVSNAGNGTYSIIYEAQQAERYAEQRLLQSIVHVAKDMKLQVEWNSALVRAYRLLGYDNRRLADDDFRDDSVDAGEVGSGHSVTALFEVVLQDDALPMVDGAPAALDGAPVAGERQVPDAALARVKVRYKKIGAAADSEALEVFEDLAGDAFVPASDASPDTRWALAVGLLAERLTQNAYSQSIAFDKLRGWLTPLADLDSDRQELVGLLDAIEALDD